MRSEEGLGARRVARQLGLSVGTVRDWHAGRLPHSYAPKSRRYKREFGPEIGCGRRPVLDACARCGADGHEFDHLSSAYVYLLGLYLGDGTISKHPRGVFKLRIFLDKKYPGIVEECELAMQAVLPWNKVNKWLTVSNCFEVYSFSKSWPCFFPQHGPGAKHCRQITLTGWQLELVQPVPELLLRGLIHSDGCRFTNTRGRSDDWSAPRYAFDNRSDDIRAIFCNACDQLGLHWTKSGKYTIYVSRKADVAALDRFVGPKL
jgi:hypothetical protein